MSMQEAFLTVCEDAAPAVSKYVSLYMHTRPYGGAEEGGWWRDHYTLMAYKEFPTEEQADAAKDAAEAMAEQLTLQAEVEHGEHVRERWNGSKREGLILRSCPRSMATRDILSRWKSGPAAASATI